MIPATPRHPWLTGIVVLVGSLSCTPSPHVIVYHTEQDQIDLREWPRHFEDVPPRTHPATVDADVLRSLLQSVHYRQSTVFAFVLGNPRPVFTPYQLSLLSEYLPRAFEQALPQEAIYFQLRDEPDGLRRTIGWCFLIGSELHLVFEEIRQPMVQPKELAPQPIAKRWELVPQPGQRRFVSRSKGAPVPNWLILPLPDAPPLSRAIPRS